MTMCNICKKQEVKYRRRSDNKRVCEDCLFKESISESPKNRIIRNKNK